MTDKVNRLRSASFVLLTIYALLSLFCLGFASVTIVSFSDMANSYIKLFLSNLLSLIGAIILFFSYTFNKATSKIQLPVAVSLVCVGITAWMVSQGVYFAPLILVFIFICILTVIDFAVKHKFSKPTCIISVILFILSLLLMFGTLSTLLYFYGNITDSDIAFEINMHMIYTCTYVISSAFFIAWFMVFYMFVYQDYKLNSTTDIILIENMLNNIKSRYEKGEISYDEYKDKKASLLSRLK